MAYNQFSRSFLSRLVALNLPFLLAAAAWCGSLQAGPVQAAGVTIGGTGAALGTMQKLADAFMQIHPEAAIRIMPNLGSGGSIKAVSAGALDIGLSSRAVTESERALGVKAQEIARTPFVIATGLKTPTVGLSFTELAAIYSGKTRTWRDGTPVRPVLRPIDDIDTTLTKNMSPELAEAITVAHARDGMGIALTDTDVADYLEKIPGAIGTSSLAVIISEGRRIKPLAINGVTPSVQSLADNNYPYHKVLYMVTNAKTSKLTQEFVKFVTSPAGATILKQNGNLVSASY